MRGIMEKEQQFIGCLLGCAIGDALGAPIENWSREKILELDNLTGYFRECHHKSRDKPFPLGQCTDDTQLTIALVKGILSSGDVDGGAIASEFVKLWQSGEIVGQGKVADNAVKRLIEGVSWDEAALIDDKPWNGAAMRMAPVGLWDHERAENLEDDVYKASVITHRHPKAISGALAIGAAVAFVVSQTEFSAGEFVESVANTVANQDEDLAKHILLIKEWVSLSDAEVLAVMDSIMTDDSRLSRKEHGWFGIPVSTEPTVLMALYAFINSPNNYLETVECALRAGGDVDTTAAIAGSISGAFNGVSALPIGLAEKVMYSREIHSLGKRLYHEWETR